METLVLASKAEKKLEAGIQLLDSRDFADLPISDGLVSLRSQNKGRLLGTAYLSPQHKGIGWVISREPIDLNQTFFERLFEKAKARRQEYAADTETSAYRLFNQDGDNFGGISIDRYNDFALFSWYNPFLYAHKEVLIQAFRKVFPEIRGAYEKCRFKEAPQESAHLYGEILDAPFLIQENGVSYSVFLNEGLMTGIFLDQHLVRRHLIQGQASGKRVLNLFSYTAAFSLAAAMGGALETTSVDLAKRSRELSQAHFIANGLDLDAHRLMVMDVFDYYKYAKRKGLVYDLIIIDPPSFARNKKQTFSVQKDYHRLIAQAVDILAPGGQIIASTNAANLTMDQFKNQVAKGMGNHGFHYQNVQQLPADFTVNPADPSSNYLKVLTLKVTK